MSTALVAPRLQGAPAAYLEPAVAPSLATAQQYCRDLATSHYENFQVATWFLPKRLQKHFYSVYAYCRVSDDLSDEVGDPLLALRLLAEWEQMLDEVYDVPSHVRHPVFVALAETVRACTLPRDLFAHLLRSFREDQTFHLMATVDDLVTYSDSSANPVGRIVLRLAGYNDAKLDELSDKTCTALQYANFWQDVGQDVKERGRIYLPTDEMQRFGVTVDQIERLEYTPAYRELMRYLVGKTRLMFVEGAQLESMVDRELASTLRLFRKGGESILHAIERIDYNTLQRRPVVSKMAKAGLLGGALMMKLAPGKRSA